MNEANNNTALNVTAYINTTDKKTHDRKISQAT